MDRSWVDENINKSLRRMDVDSLDLLQFHWWDYNDERYMEAMGHLGELRDEGKIRHLGLTNFDTHHLQSVGNQQKWDTYVKERSGGNGGVLGLP
jgi:aryl-alcohol dehydrogenase-like predicted oxidoreductase